MLIVWSSQIPYAILESQFVPLIRFNLKIFYESNASKIIFICKMFMYFTYCSWYLQPILSWTFMANTHEISINCAIVIVKTALKEKQNLYR